MIVRTQLPDPEGGVDTFLTLADLFGDEYMFRLLRAASRNTAGPNGTSDAVTAQSHLAQRMLAERGGDPDETRRDLAADLGYTPLSRTNFYKLLAGIPRHQQR